MLAAAAMAPCAVRAALLACLVAAVAGAAAQQLGDSTLPINGCDGQPDRWVTLPPGDNVTVMVGDAGRISTMRCYLHIIGGANGTATVVLAAHAETGPLVVAVSRMRIEAYAADRATDFVNVYFSSVQRVVFSFGTGALDVTVHQDTPGTEMVLSAAVGADGASLAQAHVLGTTSPGLFTGFGTVALGADQQHPLATIFGTLAVVAARNASTALQFSSSTPATAPPQRYLLDSNAVDLMDANGSRAIVPQIQPSAWFCAQMATAGADPGDCRAHQVVYAGNVSLTLDGGDDADAVQASGVRAPRVAFRGRGGADRVVWGRTGSRLFCDLGVGADTVQLTEPVGPVLLDLGVDADVDTVHWAHSGSPPNMFRHNGTVGPIGPRPDDWLVVTNILAEDAFSSLADGTGAGRPTGLLQDCGGNRTQVTLDVMFPSVHYQLASCIDLIVSCNRFALLYLFDAEPMPARDWAVVFAQVNVSAGMAGVLSASTGTNGTFVQHLDAADGATYTVTLAQPTPTLGVLTVGLLLMQIAGPDHVALTSDGTMMFNIHGTPDGADLLVQCSQLCDGQLSGLTANVLAINASLHISAGLAQSGVAVVAGGPVSQTWLDAGTAPRANYTDGCVTLAGVRAQPFTPWLQMWMQYYGVPVTPAQGCSLYTNATAQLSIAAPVVDASGLELRGATDWLTVSGDLVYRGTRHLLQAVRVAGSALSAQPRMRITVGAAARVVLEAGVFADGGHLSVDCSNASATNWTFGDASAPLLAWSGAGCTGAVDAVAASLVHVDLTPSVADSLACRIRMAGAGTGTAPVRLATLNDTVLSVLQQASQHAAAGARMLSLSWPDGALAACRIVPELAVEDGHNSMTLSLHTVSAACVPAIAIAETATTSILSLTESSVVLHAIAMIDALHESFTLGSAVDPWCFDPSSMCTPSAYADYIVNQGVVCMNPARTASPPSDCAPRPAVQLSFHHAMRCSTRDAPDGRFILSQPANSTTGWDGNTAYFVASIALVGAMILISVPASYFAGQAPTTALLSTLQMGAIIAMTYRTEAFQARLLLMYIRHALFGLWVRSLCPSQLDQRVTTAILMLAPAVALAIVTVVAYLRATKTWNHIYSLSVAAMLIVFQTSICAHLNVALEFAIPAIVVQAVAVSVTYFLERAGRSTKQRVLFHWAVMIQTLLVALVSQFTDSTAVFMIFGCIMALIQLACSITHLAFIHSGGVEARTLTTALRDYATNRRILFALCCVFPATSIICTAILLFGSLPFGGSVAVLVVWIVVAAILDVALLASSIRERATVRSYMRLPEADTPIQ